MKVAVTFDRLGRTHGLSTTINADPADLNAIGRGVHRFARKHLISAEFEVEVSSDGTGKVDFGRFGTFTWEARP